VPVLLPLVECKRDEDSTAVHMILDLGLTSARHKGVGKGNQPVYWSGVCFGAADRHFKTTIKDFLLDGEWCLCSLGWRS
jgi:hypothetical protein